jgi:hypothetical protein
MKTRLNIKQGFIQFQLEDIIAGWWTFHFTGKLAHPDKVNVYEFIKDEGVWLPKVPLEMPTRLEYELITAINSIC